jgi:hypothetical protein
MVFVDNVGEIGLQTTRFVDNRTMIVTNSGTTMGGRSVAMRGVVELGEDGGYRCYTGHFLLGEPPRQFFEGNYERR